MLITSSMDHVFSFGFCDKVLPYFPFFDYVFPCRSHYILYPVLKGDIPRSPVLGLGLFTLRTDLWQPQFHVEDFSFFQPSVLSEILFFTPNCPLALFTRYASDNSNSMCPKLNSSSSPHSFFL